MTRFLIYLFPAIADLIVAATMFVCSIRLADAGRSRAEVAMVFATWAAVYIASNLILSRFVTSRNAAAMLIVANLLFTATAGTFVLIEGIWAELPNVRDSSFSEHETARVRIPSRGRSSLLQRLASIEFHWSGLR